MSYEQEQIKFSRRVFQELFENSRRLWKMIWRERGATVITLVLVFLFVSAMPFVQSGMRGLLINNLVHVAGSGVYTQGLIIIIGILVVATILVPLLNALQYYLLRIFWYFLDEQIELLILKRFGIIDIASREDPKQNDLFVKVRENGIWRAQNFVDRQFYILQNITEVVIASVILVSASWWVFALILVGTIPELLTEMKYGREVWGIYGGRAEVRRRFWDLRRHFDYLPYVVELKLFQNTTYFWKKVQEIFKLFQGEQLVIEKKKIIRQLMVLIVSQGALVFATIWFITEVIQGRLLIGTLTFLLASIGELRQSLSGLFGNLGRQYSDSLFVTDIFKVVDLPRVLSAPKKPVSLSMETPEIIFDDVSFSYPGVEEAALSHVNLHITAGQKLALVGSNGAGKTTLVKLLCRFYDPTEGRILVNGVDLREVDMQSWYHVLGVLFQDYAQYHLPVREAIAFGRTDAEYSLKKIEDAAHASEAYQFIEAWPHRYDQMLGKEFTEGVEPSIGQWQKMALARIFYRDPRVYILDEPTASIDAEAEANIFDKLGSLPNDRTVILISHRFSTVRHADTIAVFENGTISEMGSHAELLKNNRTYARLFKLQAKGYQ